MPEKISNQSRPEEPVVIVGGFMSSPADYTGWQQVLQGSEYRRHSLIANITRGMWTATRNGDLHLQINALDTAVERALQASDARRVWLVCHSAGGLVARLWMGEYSYAGVRCNGHDNVRGIVMLGSPYTSAEANAKPATSFANTHYPGAFYPDVEYVSVIGRSVYGKANGTFVQRLAYNSYQKLDPRKPEQWGDGVITLAAAHLPGAKNHVVDNVFHLSVLGQPGYTSPLAMAVWGSYLNQTVPAVQAIAG